MKQSSNKNIHRSLLMECCAQDVPAFVTSCCNLRQNAYRTIKQAMWYLMIVVLKMWGLSLLLVGIYESLWILSKTHKFIWRISIQFNPTENILILSGRTEKYSTGISNNVRSYCMPSTAVVKSNDINLL